MSARHPAEARAMFRRISGYRYDCVTIHVDGVPVEAAAGEYVAGVLLRNAPYTARKTTLSGSARAPFCMMGVCTDCAATVDGVPSTLTCRTLVRDGMQVRHQDGPPRLGTGGADADA